MCATYLNELGLVKLCRFHHDQLHKGHYSIELLHQTQQNHGQRWLFKTTAGDVIESSSVLPTPKTPLEHPFLNEQLPNINSGTAVPHWQGEKLDYQMAIKALCGCKHQQKARFHRRSYK
jgi:hypothetical protein